jgi:GTP-binding protein YchF
MRIGDKKQESYEIMKIGLIGLPNSGKTTVFNALTGSEASVTAYSSDRAKPHVAVVDVKDERVKRLSEMYNPRKTVYATVEFVDFAGLSAGSAREGIFSGEAMGMMRMMDAFALVVRNFKEDPMGPPAPLKDMGKLEEELLVSDMIVAESRLERIQHGYKRGQKSDALQREEAVLTRILDHLNKALPIRDLELTPDEHKMIRGFQFLTWKPIMVILNSDESRFGMNGVLLGEMEKTHRAIEFAGNFEMELTRLDDQEETRLFMEDMGIKESASYRLTWLAYKTLGYISFFTVGSDEVRAWNVCRGNTALDAAGTIHTDLAKGFIRAECFSYEDCLQFGTEKGLRENGLLRLEGKEYPVQDGDIMNIRFNI